MGFEEDLINIKLKKGEKTYIDLGDDENRLDKTEEITDFITYYNLLNYELSNIEKQVQVENYEDVDDESYSINKDVNINDFNQENIQDELSVLDKRYSELINKLKDIQYKLNIEVICQKCKRQVKFNDYCVVCGNSLEDAESIKIAKRKTLAEERLPQIISYQQPTEQIGEKIYPLEETVEIITDDGSPNKKEEIALFDSIIYNFTLAYPLTFGALVIFTGIFEIIVGFWIPPKVSGVLESLDIMAFVLTLFPGSPVDFYELSDYGFTKMGLIHIVLGINLALLGIGIWKQQQISRYILSSFFIISGLLNLVRFLEKGFLNAPFSVFALVLNIYLSSFYLKKFN